MVSLGPNELSLFPFSPSTSYFRPTNDRKSLLTLVIALDASEADSLSSLISASDFISLSM